MSEYAELIRELRTGKLRPLLRAEAADAIDSLLLKLDDLRAERSTANETIQRERDRADELALRLDTETKRAATYRKGLEDIVKDCGTDYYLETTGDQAQAVLDAAKEIK